MRSILLCSGAVLLVAASACASAASSESDAGVDSGITDASAADVSVEAGVDARYEDTFPAPHAPIPTVEPQQGVPANVMVHPKIVTITFDTDSAKPDIQAFTDAMVGSDWWTATTHEYCAGTSGECIGPLSIAAHVSLPTPPDSLDVAQVEAYLYGLIADKTVPAPSKDVLYTFFFPASVKLGQPGFEACNAFDGYHSLSGMLPDGTVDAGALDGGPMPNVAYAVVARCSKDINEVTLTAAHEWIEAATDPDGYGYTVDDAAWAAFFYPEVGDLCDFEPTNRVGKYAVQSGFSNMAAKAGKNPCVPGTPGELYFNAAPEKPRVKVAVGQSITINVMPYSEKGAGEFTLDAIDLASLYGKAAVVEATVDQTTVHNGLPVTVTLKLLSKPEPLNTGEVAAVVALRSTQGKVSHYWPVLVAPK
jgi:hypothetical protein